MTTKVQELNYADLLIQALTISHTVTDTLTTNNSNILLLCQVNYIG